MLPSVCIPQVPVRPRACQTQVQKGTWRCCLLTELLSGSAANRYTREVEDGSGGPTAGPSLWHSAESCLEGGTSLG